MQQFKPTAIPLITADPYFSIWSFGDHLYDDSPRSWWGNRAAMTGLLRVDGTWYRFMGKVQPDNRHYFQEPMVLPQTSVQVGATKTGYCFENELVKMELDFRTPLLCEELSLMSRPVSYISYKVDFKDEKEHEVLFYFDMGAEICVENLSDTVEFGKTEVSVYCGKGEKDVLKRSGDMMGIEWGNLHLAAPEMEYHVVDSTMKERMVQGKKNSSEDICEARAVCNGFPSISASRLWKQTRGFSGFLCTAYDDIDSIEYFGERLKAYWRETGDSFETMLKKAVRDYDKVQEICDRFDKELQEDASRISEKYADILSLAYRQVVSSHKLVQKDGKLLYFSKECGSNGCLGTVDVTYPSIPMFLYYKPELVEGMLNPIFEYAEKEHGWHYEFAPHDVGQYPIANGQVYGYDRKTREMKYDMQMPIEECGNMLLCVAALCAVKKDYTYAKEHREILAQWADYLVKTVFSSESQLCTDDFAGHLAGNVNLSAKGILGIAAWGAVLNAIGEDGSSYAQKAKEYAGKWNELAQSGDHYMLAFGHENTWSLKYNLVWDRLLHLDVFDPDIFEAEVAFYKTRVNRYGIPLDSRSDYTKSDWQMWSVCLTGDQEYREMIIGAMWDMLCDMEERVPFSDWYYTSEPHRCGTFQARTVQGGLFLPLLEI